MKVTIHENSKAKQVSYWLTKAESANPRIQDMIKSVSSKWKAKGYKVVVFMSGEEDLAELTKELLRHQIYDKRSAAMPSKQR